MLSKAITQELIANMREIESFSRTLPKASLNGQQVARGLEVSARACAQPGEVAMSPYCKDLLTRFGDIKDDERLLVGAKATKAEEWLTRAVTQYLLTKTGHKLDKYDTSKSLVDVEHYWRDCWDNVKQGTDWRQIQPGMEKQRQEMLLRFTRPTRSTQLVRNLYDPEFSTAVELVLNELPNVVATNDWVEPSMPFQRKLTNVGAPWFNRAPNIDRMTGKSYGQLAMELSKKIGNNWGTLAKYYMICAFGRNVRGKGRLIQGVPRVVNISFNRLEMNEIEAYKYKSPLFAGYSSRSDLKDILIKMFEDADKVPLAMANYDFSWYDETVSRDDLLLLGAMSMHKAKNSLGKEIAKVRAAFMLQSQILDGMSQQIRPVFGRIFSGELDTNRGGGIINAYNNTASCIHQDRNYVAHVSRLRYRMLVMGDDNLMVIPRDWDEQAHVKFMASRGYEVNPDKKAWGVFFLQNRLFKIDQTYHMAYPFPRVVRQTLFREDSAGLGPYGWLITAYQQLEPLVDYADALRFPANLLWQLDRQHLALDQSVSQIVEGIKSEDQKAYSELRTEAQRRQFRSTFTKKDDGDPQKSEFMADLESGGSKGYIANIQSKLRQVIDPNFFKIGRAHV